MSLESAITVCVGGQTTSGVSASTTVIVNVQVLELPAASVAVNSIVVTPTGNSEPLARPAV